MIRLFKLATRTVGIWLRIVARDLIPLVLFFGTALLLSSCSDEVPSAPEDTFESRLELALGEGFGAASHTKGVSVAVEFPGRPMWTGATGISHGNVLIHPSSVFAAGSITKTFTAITVLRLAEEGHLSLDDSVHTWFPPYPYVDPDITIRQLLSHTSGLSDFVDDPDWFQALYADPTRVWGMEEYLLQTIAPPYFEKGTAWSYSSTGYVLLRMLIEQISGMTVAEAYHQYILEPLDLQDTYVCPGDILPTRWAHGWLDLTGDGFYDDFYVLSPTAFCTAAGGQVYSTAADLARLGVALMKDRTILSDASYAEMTDFYYPVGHDERMVDGYGLGLMVFDPSFTGGYTVWGHGGNAPGYAAGMLYLPDFDAVVGIMDNTEEGEAMNTIIRVFQVIEEESEGS